jgi:hypothetical protein
MGREEPPKCYRLAANMNVQLWNLQSQCKREKHMWQVQLGWEVDRLLDVDNVLVGGSTDGKKVQYFMRPLGLETTK